MNVIMNAHGELLVFMSSTGARWHTDIKHAKKYPTLRGCRNAATKFSRRFPGATFNAKKFVQRWVAE